MQISLGLELRVPSHFHRFLDGEQTSPNTVFLSRHVIGHLAMPKDACDCPQGGGVTGIQWIKSRDEAKHPTMHRDPHYTQRYLTLSVNRTYVGNTVYKSLACLLPWSSGSLFFLRVCGDDIFFSEQLPLEVYQVTIYSPYHKPQWHSGFPTGLSHLSPTSFNIVI